MTQWEDVRKKVIFAMSDATKNIQTVDGATKKAGEALQDNFGAKLQKMWRDTQADFKPLGDDLLKIAKDTLPKIASAVGSVTNAFADMSPKTRDVVLGIAGLAAAAGPVAIGIGSITSAAGLALKALSPIVATIGAEGLAGSLTALAGPIGLTVAGIGLVAGATIGLSKAYNDHKTVSFEVLQSRQKEIEKNDELIKNFDQLKAKNQLSNDEMMRFLDINSLLSQTASPQRIAELKDEQGKLLEKSGLTNKEIQDFLSYNDQIIQKAPNTEKAISSEGNAYATNTQELQKVNSEKLKSLKMDAEAAITDSLEKENRLLADKQKAINYISQKEQERKIAYESLNTLNSQIQAKDIEIGKLKADQEENLRSKDLDRIKNGQTKLDIANREKETLSAQMEAEKSKLEAILKQLAGKQGTLNKTDEELKKLDANKYKYEQIVLEQLGLNTEKGKGLEMIQQEISKLEKQKSQLQELHRSGQLNTAEYNNQVGEIDTQIGRLQTAQGELRNVNDLAGKTIYKDVKINSPKAEIDNINAAAGKSVVKTVSIAQSSIDYANEFNRILGQTVSKSIIINAPSNFQNGIGFPKQRFAAATNNAPGGLMLVGDDI